MKTIDIVIPIYNEQDVLKLFYDDLIKNIECLFLRFYFTLIFVDDGSDDNTYTVLQELQKKDEGKVKFQIISFSKNFGHQAAIKAGIDTSEGDALIIMDGDLEHPPSLLPKMIMAWEEGAHVVNTSKIKSYGIFNIYSLFSSLFYKVLTLLADEQIVIGDADFKVLDARVRDELKKMNENALYLRGLITWVGFNNTCVIYDAIKRPIGRSSYKLFQRIKLAINAIVSFSNKPLYMIFYTGMIISLLTSLYIIYVVFAFFFLNRSITGWTSLIVSVLFFGSLMLTFIGVISLYLAKVFAEVKKRPIYITRER